MRPATTKRFTGLIFVLSSNMTATAIATVRNYGRETRVLAPSPRKNSTPAPEKIPRRALVVDDEPLIRWSVAETLTAAGLSVMQAADAASALRIITNEERPFDAIVLDLRLPDMRDLSLLGTLRQLQPRAAIVLMTAFGTDDVVERAIALGVQNVLQKPFEMDQLVEAVDGATN
jgi:DNA-binding NtrC family response regulator